MKKIYLVLFVIFAACLPMKASAYWHGGGGCCYGGGHVGIGIGFYDPLYAPVYAPAYPPVYGGYAYPAPYYAPPPQVVYADPGYAAAPPSQEPVYANSAPAAAPGQECREYRGPIVIGGKTQQGYGTACRQPDGTWHMVSQQ